MVPQASTRSLPVGVFDSGIGGLTVLRELRAALPLESFIYLGDTARVPYGNRGEATIIRYARMACGFLAGRGIKALVVACNTVSSVAIDMIRVEFDLPVLGVIDPPASAACLLVPGGRIGVLGTRRTVQSGAYDRAIQQADSRCEVFSNAAPLLVPLAEEGWVEGEVPRLVCRSYIEPLVHRRIDALLLGCTHYPVLAPMLGSIVSEMSGRQVPIVNSASSVAAEVARFLRSRSIEVLPGGPAVATRFYVTDNPGAFMSVAGTFFGADVEESSVEIVDL